MATKKTKTKPKKTTKNRKLLIALLLLLLLFLLGAGATLLFKFSGKPGTYVHKNSKGDYVLLANGRPFLIKGVCYSPIPVGEGYVHNWWGNAAKPWMSDGKLMQDAGINTVRFYEPGDKPEQVKQVISDLYENYGIRSIMGHGLGFWDFPHANYADPDFQL